MRKRDLKLLNESYEAQMEKANGKIIDLKAEIENLNDEIFSLESQLKEKDNQIEALNETINSQSTKADTNSEFVEIDGLDKNKFKNGFEVTKSGFDFSFDDNTVLASTIIGKIFIKAGDALSSIQARKLPDIENLKEKITNKANDFKISVVKILADLDLKNPKEELEKISDEVENFFKKYII